VFQGGVGATGAAGVVLADEAELPVTRLDRSIVMTPLLLEVLNNPSR
jgi:hypothetical protein